MEERRRGIEAHELSSLARSAGLLQEFPSFSSEGDISTRIAQHDHDVDRYEKNRGETFPPSSGSGMALCVLQHRSLKQHQVLNSSRLTTRSQGRDRQSVASAGRGAKQPASGGPLSGRAAATGQQ